MKRLAAALGVGLALCLTAHADIPKVKPGDPLPANIFVELAKAVNPAVVNVFTTYLPKGRRGSGNNPNVPVDPFFEMFEQFMGPNGGRPAPTVPQQSLGSGFIIRDDGLIITNNHVIDHADDIQVQISENAKDVFKARLIGKDARTDIALIKIDAKRKLPFVKLGSSAKLEVGEWVAAFGNPYGYGHTVTKGIVSALGREIDELNLFPFIQTDASINPGNSGGPLVNIQGEVIGVNTAIDARGQGIGFVIPIDNVKSELPTLEKDGGIKRAFLGVQMADIDEDGADSLGLKQVEGALITQVLPETAASRAGVQPYDLVVEYNGQKIESTGELSKAVANTPVGKDVKMKVVRNGKPRELTVHLGSDAQLSAVKSTPKKKGDSGVEAPSELGFTMAEYSIGLAQEFGLPRLTDPRPVVVAVDPAGLAAHAGLAAGDIILDLNRVSVSRARDVLKSIRKSGLNVFRVLRQDRVVLVSVRAP